jgi:ADYC domain-containing protein
MRPGDSCRLLGIVALLCLASGCLAGGPDTEESSGAVIEGNGLTLNGPVLNGSALNGQTLNGHRINGHRINGPDFNGLTTFNGLVYVTLEDGGSVELIAGDTLTATLDDGRHVPIHVLSTRVGAVPTVSEFGEEVSKSTAYYQLTYDSPDDGYTYDYCPNGREAVALAGRWDPISGAKTISDPFDMTFACMGYALGKCYEMGYVPEIEVGFEGDYFIWDRLELAHQACVRALRADYCGDGTSYTVDGTLVDIFDFMGVQYQSGSVIEAVFSPDGAMCLSTPRRVSRDQVACAGALPYCTDPPMLGYVDIGIPINQ